MPGPRSAHNHSGNLRHSPTAIIPRLTSPHLLAVFLPVVVHAAPLHKEMVGKDGKPVICDKVWISCLSEGQGGNAELRKGQLTAGFGERTETIGPEFTFRITMEKQLKVLILIINDRVGQHDFAGRTTMVRI
jgi:hypothetical protein